MNNILVVGGAGYIGAHIVDLLCESGFNVIVLDNLSTGYKENLNSKAQFILGDITNKDDLNNVFLNNNIDSVIHMAAFKSVEESIRKISSYTENNIIGSLNLISSSLEFNVNKFIFSSTAAVYGNPEYNPIDENHSIFPLNHYGFTKYYIENYLKWISKIKSFKFVSLRYFNAAGYTSKNQLIKYKEKNPENLLPIIMEVANGKRNKLNIFGNDYSTKDGTCIRDYIHVLDLAKAHIRAIYYLNKNKENTTINLSTGKGYSVLEIVNIVEKVLSKKINFEFQNRRKGDPAILISKFDKANKLLDWTPEYSIEDIISSMWELYKIDS